MLPNLWERLQTLKRIVPTVDKLAMAFNGNNANNAAQFELLRSEAQKLGIAVEPLDIRKPEDVDAAFDKALAFGAKGLVNAVDTFINSRRFALAAGAAKHKLPFVYSGTITAYAIPAALGAVYRTATLSETPSSAPSGVRSARDSPRYQTE